MNRITTTLFALMLVAQPIMAEEWQLKKDKQGIQVSTRSEPGSRHKAVQATMLVQIPVRELVALVLDTEACPNWAALCKESYVARAVTDSQFYVYTYNDLPWPVADRDVVALVNWQVDTDNQKVVMTADIVDGVVEPHKKALRLSEGKTRWTFTRTAEGTLVHSYAHLNPGGGMPAWVTNMLLVDSPFDTLNAMRKHSQSGKYAHVKVPFLPEGFN